MCALTVATYIVQSHLIFSSPGLGLEEYRIACATPWAWMVVCPWQCWVLYHFWVNVPKFINFMHQLVDINTIIFCGHFVITVPAGIKQYLVFLVFFWVQHIVTLLTETDADKTWSISSTFCHKTHGCCCFVSKLVEIKLSGTVNPMKTTQSIARCFEIGRAHV